MSPASNKHGFIQNQIGSLLQQYLPAGGVIAECSIQTTSGIKVADVIWGSHEFFLKQNLEQDPFQLAPEICVEIISPFNSEIEMQEKIALYLAQSAEEVWLVDLTGACRFFNQNGEQVSSCFVIPDEAWNQLGKI